MRIRWRGLELPSQVIADRVALSAWTIQKLCKGRFTLGLGPQVRGHIERRYGMKWSPPGPWMREYVGAVPSLWDC